MKNTAKWIHAPRGIGEISPEFRKSVNTSKKVIKAEALVSAFGVYDFFVNLVAGIKGVCVVYKNLRGSDRLSNEHKKSALSRNAPFHCIKNKRSAQGVIYNVNNT